MNTTETSSLPAVVGRAKYGIDNETTPLVSLGIGATTNTLSYTKIGQVVHFRGYINNDTFSGASGDVTITGFPFAVSDLTKFSERPAILISVTGSSDNGAKAGIMTATGTTVIMQTFNASALDTDVDLYLSGSYPTG